MTNFVSFNLMGTKTRAAAIERLPRAVFASVNDPRFGYCLFVPDGFRDAPAAHHLLVTVHGSSRGAMAYRDNFSEFAAREGCVVIAPLFPVGPLGDGNGDGYKFLIEGGIRYDKILLAIIAEVEEALAHEFGRFFLTGFSGGGQFAHRFLYLHPRLLRGVSIGAPGAITRISNDYDYWLGTRDWEAHFDKPLDIGALGGVPVQLLVGEKDTAEFSIPKAFAANEEAIDRFGRNRIDRVNLLRADFESFGVRVSHDILPGVGHEGLKTIPAVESFLARLIAEPDAARTSPFPVTAGDAQ